MTGPSIRVNLFSQFQSDVTDSQSTVAEMNSGRTAFEHEMFAAVMLHDSHGNLERHFNAMRNGDEKMQDLCDSGLVGFKGSHQKRRSITSPCAASNKYPKRRKQCRCRDRQPIGYQVTTPGRFVESVILHEKVGVVLMTKSECRRFNQQCAGWFDEELDRLWIVWSD